MIFFSVTESIDNKCTCTYVHTYKLYTPFVKIDEQV